METVESINKDWPIIFKSKHGPQLIMIDFDLMSDNLQVKGNIEDNWDNFFDHIHQNTKCENVECKTALDYCNFYTTTEGGKMMAQLSHSAHLYPLKGNSKVQNRPSKEGINISKSIRSIIEHAKVGNIFVDA